MCDTAVSYCLNRLTAEDVAALGARIVMLGKGAGCRREAAELVVRALDEALRDETGNEPGSVLVRCFQTCPYARLPMEYQDAAESLLEALPSHPKLRCLALLATRGRRQVWNDVATSTGHQAIPLPSVEVVRRAPMVARLLDQMGVPLERVVALRDEGELLMEESGEGFNVFHVAVAEESPFLPAQQQFVRPYGVRSVVGMGGLLPEGEMFAVLVFARVEIGREVAALFRALAMQVQEVLGGFAAKDTFARLED